MMKNLFAVKVIGAVLVFALLSFSFREANYYVVIGSFSKELNARKFTGYARNIYLEAFYRFNADRNLYYVYVMQTPRKEDARNWTWYLKNETGFKDAWVFTESPDRKGTYTFFDQSGIRYTSPRYSGSDLLPRTTSASIALASAEDNSNLSYVSDLSYVNESPALTIDAAWTSAEEISYTANIKNNFLPGKDVRLLQGNVFTFTAETSDGKTIPTEVMLVDYKKAKKVAGFHTGEYIGLRGKKQNQALTLVCDVFGYSVETKVLNLNKLSGVRDVKQNEQGVWEVKFRLKPMQLNEISILYNTVFYPDAAVLQPSSKKQVDQLLGLMKANPAYKILIHSHCNARSRRDVKLPGKNANYFSLDSSLQKTASDKQLTKHRGETIRSYLVDNGIDGKRMQVFGWGSLENLVTSTSADTGINDRIEVELVEK